MSVADRFRRLFGGDARTATRSAAFASNLAFGPTGAHVGLDTVMAANLATCAACIGAISSAIASLPALVYRVRGGRRSEAPDHPVSRLIRAPNLHLTWPDLVEWLLGQVLTYGNALAIIEHDGAGRAIGLRPVPWPNVLVSLLPSGRLAFDITAFVAPWGGTGVPRRYLEDEVFLLRDRSDDGLIGRSRVSRAPDAIRNAFALQEHSTNIWRRAASPAGVIRVPSALSPEAAKRMAQSWSDSYGGSGNSGKTAVLEEGVTFEPLSVSPEDAEILASRRFSVEEICRLYQVPPPIVQDYTHGTFTNTAQAALWFAQLTLTPWVRKIEAEFARSVFADDSAHIEIDMSGLMRGDYSARWATYASAVGTGILTRDEVRQAEGYDPLPGDAVPEPPIAETGP